MSDSPQGPGWWQASDGRWYPPATHPQPWAAPPTAYGPRTTAAKRSGCVTALAVFGAIAAALAALVAVILVIVFAVGGTGDKGQAMSCRIDTRTLRTAEEAYFAGPDGAGRYTSEAQLVPTYLAQPSPMHDIRVDGTGKSFVIVIADARCGTVGHTVGQTPEDL